MGREKYVSNVDDIFKKSPVVSFMSVERIVGKRQYAKQFIRNLVLKGKIKRLAKGWYTSNDNISLAVFCFKPAYLGLQDAMSFHNIWEQETIPVIVAAGKARQGIRNVMGGNILVRRLSRKYLFGFDYYDSNSFYLPYSDVEKTFIDMVYFNENLSKEVLLVFKKKIEMKKLNLYLKSYPKRFRERVLSLWFGKRWRC